MANASTNPSKSTSTPSPETQSTIFRDQSWSISIKIVRQGYPQPTKKGSIRILRSTRNGWNLPNLLFSSVAFDCSMDSNKEWISESMKFMWSISVCNSASSTIVKINRLPLLARASLWICSENSPTFSIISIIIRERGRCWSSDIPASRARSVNNSKI